MCLFIIILKKKQKHELWTNHDSPSFASDRKQGEGYDPSAASRQASVERGWGLDFPCGIYIYTH